MRVAEANNGSSNHDQLRSALHLPPDPTWINRVDDSLSHHQAQRSRMLAALVNRYAISFNIFALHLLHPNQVPHT